MAAPNLSPISRLPPELLASILSLVDPRPTLLDAALVCRRWRTPAQEALVRTICFAVDRNELDPPLDSSTRVLEWLSSASAVLGGAVRTLAIDGLDRETLDKVLGTCTRLTALHFVSQSPHWPSRQLPWDVLAHSRLDGITRLVLSNEICSEPIDDSATAVLPFHLVALELDLSELGSSLEILVPACSGSLTRLTISRAPPSLEDAAPMIASLLPALADTLRHLHILLRDDSSESWEAILGAFPNLDRLSLTLPYDSAPRPDTFAALAAAFPRSVKLLTVPFELKGLSPTYFSLHPIATFVLHPNLEHLVAVELPDVRAAELIRCHGGTKLQSLCASRAIELRTSTGLVEQQPQVEVEDPRRAG